MKAKYHDIAVTFRPNLPRRTLRRLAKRLEELGCNAEVGVDGIAGQLEKHSTQEDLEALRSEVLRLTEVSGRTVKGAIVARGAGCVCNSCVRMRRKGMENTDECRTVEAFVAVGIPIVGHVFDEATIRATMEDRFDVRLPQDLIGPPGLQGLRVRFRRLDHGRDLPPPARASEGSSGYDLRAAIGSEFCLAPRERLLVPTGIALEMPTGWEAQVRPRSGLALRHGVTILGSPGTIDSDYRGEVGALLVNQGTEPYTFRRGERVAQLVFARVASVSWEEVDELATSERGEGGWGSSGA